MSHVRAFGIRKDCRCGGLYCDHKVVFKEITLVAHHLLWKDDSGMLKPMQSF
jgi:hypothetical protein